MPASSESSSGNGNLSVLIIDDQPIVRDWTRGVLRSMGITQVSEASDGRDAIAKVTQPGAQFDLILCDLGMPGRDGVETIRSLAALGIDSSVAILSMEEERIIEMAATLVETQGLRLVGTIEKPLTAAKMDKILARMSAGRAAGLVRPRRSRRSSTSPKRSSVTSCASCTSRRWT